MGADVLMKFDIQTIEDLDSRPEAIGQRVVPQAVVDERIPDERILWSTQTELHLR